MESVIFMQHCPLRVLAESRPVIDMMSTIQGKMLAATSSFQHMGMPKSAKGIDFISHQQHNQQQHDPFYLDSGAPLESESNLPSCFGTIQLTDSDVNDADNVEQKKKKKRQQKESTRSATLGDADFATVMMMRMKKTVHDKERGSDMGKSLMGWPKWTLQCLCMRMKSCLNGSIA